MVNRPEYVEPADAAMAAWLASNLSPFHRREIAETAGVDAARALALSVATSAEAYGYCPDPGKPVFMMGVERASPLTGLAMAWMLGRPDMARHARHLLRAARWGRDRAFALTGAEMLYQLIPSWYGTGLRFAARMGFLPIGESGGAVHVVCPRRTPAGVAGRRPRGKK